ncbi:hypothetical protein SAMN05216403_1336 [Nitrosospira multiformis ATCC 25196]|uniref:Uncharacterized protein n=1 Tax=Nitrosospira multiformis (strain ATCC 25196 / NCIMB 11849 / C 71) TaxID=323848 RepID=A0A1H5XLC7_NITMU|nr:hypothetical protein SAMN05216403_1336 [Nitrosospira multiformis ATCC 25196]
MLPNAQRVIRTDPAGFNLVNLPRNGGSGGNRKYDTANEIISGHMPEVWEAVWECQ